MSGWLMPPKMPSRTDLEQPFADEYVATCGYVEHLFGCHRFLFCELTLSEPCASAESRAQKAVRDQTPATAARMTSITYSGWESIGTWLLSMS